MPPRVVLRVRGRADRPRDRDRCVQTVACRRRHRLPARRPVHRARRGPARPPAQQAGTELMARKLPVLQRVLGAPTLFSVAYGEIASSIYFALGIIAGHALGLTPEVLLLTGLLFLARRFVLRRGHHSHPGDRRRGDAGAQGLQRLRRASAPAGCCSSTTSSSSRSPRSSCRTTSAGRWRSRRCRGTRGTSSSASPRSSPSPSCACSGVPVSTRPGSAWPCSTS